ncbi:MAG: alpha/beta fold hydrolase [Dehalococcoidia bacterium]
MPVEATPVAVRGGMFNPPVFRAGKGGPLLYLHAAGGLKGFTPDLEALAQSYEVIAPVLPGWEDTDGLQHIDDVWDMTIFLQDLCDVLGLKQMNVLGHSLGGMMAAELAAARPDMVKKLVLTCPVGFWIPETPVADFFAMMPADLVPTLFGDPNSPAVAQMMKPPANEDELAQMMYLNAVNLSAAGKFMWPIPDRGLKKRIYRISSPTLLLWGDSDRLTPPAYGDLFHSKIASSQLKVIKGAGHMLPIEKTEEYVAEIKGFLG